MQQITQIRLTLRQANCRKTATCVAICVGTLLFTINHGTALLEGGMTEDRWVSALFTYLVPFMVSIHGQSNRVATSQAI